MIIKLHDRQITKFWAMLRFAIAETFMPRNTCTNAHLQYILKCLLAGKMQCWIVFDGSQKERKFIGFIVTRIDVTNSIGERTLFLDSVYTWDHVPLEIVEKAYGVMEEFAKQNLCKSIVTLTENPNVVRMAENGGYSKRFYLFKEV